MDGNVVWIALITLAGTVVTGLLAPAILLYLKRGSDQETQALDWARQDAVADRLFSSNERVAKAAKEAASQTNLKLDVIHTLVNSNMTASMQSELDSTVRELILLRVVLGLHKDAGKGVDNDTLLRIKTAENRVVELQALLKDRLTQSSIAEEQQKRQKKE